MIQLLLAQRLASEQWAALLSHDQGAKAVDRVFSRLHARYQSLNPRPASSVCQWSAAVKQQGPTQQIPAAQVAIRQRSVAQAVFVECCHQTMCCRPTAKAAVVWGWWLRCPPSAVFVSQRVRQKQYSLFCQWLGVRSALA